MPAFNGRHSIMRARSGLKVPRTVGHPDPVEIEAAHSQFANREHRPGLLGRGGLLVCAFRSHAHPELSTRLVPIARSTWSLRHALTREVNSRALEAARHLTTRVPTACSKERGEVDFERNLPRPQRPNRTSRA